MVLSSPVAILRVRLTITFFCRASIDLLSMRRQFILSQLVPSFAAAAFLSNASVAAVLGSVLKETSVIILMVMSGFIAFLTIGFKRMS